MFGVANVAYGSNSEVELADADFRFTPESGLRADIAPCPKSANNGSRILTRLPPSASEKRVGIVGLAPGIGPWIPALHGPKNVRITAGWGKLSSSFADVPAVVTSG